METMDTVSLPSDEEVEQANRFRTYLHYIEHMSLHLQTYKINPQKIISAILNTKQFEEIRGGRCKDIKHLGQLLRNAWFTELQMDISGANDELVSYSVHWAPVQAYYVVYLGLRAFVTSRLMRPSAIPPIETHLFGKVALHQKSSPCQTHDFAFLRH